MAEVPVKDKIEYTVALVSDFAKKYSLSTTQAFNYLDRFNAIDFVNQTTTLRTRFRLQRLLMTFHYIAKITEETSDVFISWFKRL